MASSIASRWRELSGENNWDSLLHPLDLDLRRYLIHYLQRAGAAEEAFNENKASKTYGFSLYPPEEYFASVGLELGNPYKYEVTNFINAATGSEAAYFGYVAVATNKGKEILGRRDILVSWRGTKTTEEWVDDANILLTSAKELFGNDTVAVHSGFLSIYTGTLPNSPYAKTSARDQVRKAVQELVDKYQNEEVSITVTGHSLGAALATLNAVDMAANGWNKPIGSSNKAFMVTAFPSGCPRVGNVSFKNIFDGLKDLHLLRIVNSTDIVPKLPLILPGLFTHVGHELLVDTKKSPYLKSNMSAHNLEGHEHGIAGVQENGEFKLEEELDFDIPVINKNSDGLLDELKIPDKWWNKEKFKNMVQMHDGRSKFNDSYYVPDPPSV